tara:strand:- start:82 stop:1425 length:1344 start_codon:yes stop_codon:yes gene_type:complete
MKKLLLLLIIPLLFSCGGDEKKKAQNIIPEKEESGGDEKKKVQNIIPEKEERNSILWKIEKDKKVSYLFGTVHYFCENENIYKNVLKNLVDEVDIIVFESSDEEIDEVEGKGILGQDILDDNKVVNMFTKYELQELYDYLSFIGHEEEYNVIINMDFISFFLILETLCFPDCELAGSEIYIESILDEKKLFYLEGNSDLSAIASKWANYTHQHLDMIEFDAQNLMEEAYDICSGEEKREDMVNYNNNDPQADWDEFIDSASDDSFSKVMVDGMVIYLLNERNKIWLPRMIDFMNNNKTLFAVGSLHVLDLVERLEKEGYILTPLDVSSTVIEGCVFGDCINGNGTYLFNNLDTYEGEWKDDLMHGQGVYTFDNGDKYEGEWKNGLYHGQGTLFQDGEIFEGQWNNGEWDEDYNDYLNDAVKEIEEIFEEQWNNGEWEDAMEEYDYLE